MYLYINGAFIRLYLIEKPAPYSPIVHEIRQIVFSSLVKKRNLDFSDYYDLYFENQVGQNADLTAFLHKMSLL